MLFSTNVKDQLKLNEVDSTNSYLLDGDFSSGVTCLAKIQKAGKGRFGKTWTTNENGSFIFSGLLIFSKGKQPENFTFLSILTALSIIDALQDFATSIQLKKMTNQKLYVKWPNDVLMSQGSSVGKLAGILIESKIFNGETKFVIGIGLNWSGQVEVCDNNLFSPISYFSQSECKPDVFLPFLIKSFNKNALSFYEHGSESLIEKIHSVFYLLNDFIECNYQKYKVLGIQNTGSLLLENEFGLRKEIQNIDEKINWEIPK